MAAPMHIATISGLRELDRNLNELASQYGPRNALSALRLPMRRSLEVVANHIRANTPVDSGGLRDSTGFRVNMASSRLRRSRFVGPNAVLVGRVGWQWTSPSLWYQALSVEYGNRVSRAQPTIRPALSVLSNEAITRFAPALADNIERTARRLGRRAAAGTLRRR